LAPSLHLDHSVLVGALYCAFHGAHAQAEQLQDRKGLYTTANGVDDQWNLLS